MQNWSLQTKMIAGSIMAVLIPLLVVGGFSTYKSSGELQNYAQSQSAEMAKGLASMLDVGL